VTGVVGTDSTGAPRRAKAGDRRRSGPVVGIVRLLAIAATVTAVVRELMTPRAERVWHGTVWGFVPYDFRLPRLHRIRRRLWSPSDPRIFVPTIFGVGWTVNFAALVAHLHPAPHSDANSDPGPE
jgi:hypothetical protein